jgi:hypothetical protein
MLPTPESSTLRSQGHANNNNNARIICWPSSDTLSVRGIVHAALVQHDGLTLSLDQLHTIVDRFKPGVARRTVFDTLRRERQQKKQGKRELWTYLLEESRACATQFGMDTVRPDLPPADLQPRAEDGANSSDSFAAAAKSIAAKAKAKAEMGRKAATEGAERANAATARATALAAALPAAPAPAAAARAAAAAEAAGGPCCLHDLQCSANCRKWPNGCTFGGAPLQRLRAPQPHPYLFGAVRGQLCGACADRVRLVREAVRAVSLGHELRPRCLQHAAASTLSPDCASGVERDLAMYEPRILTHAPRLPTAGGASSAGARADEREHDDVCALCVGLLTDARVVTLCNGTLAADDAREGEAGGRVRCGLAYHTRCLTLAGAHVSQTAAPTGPDLTWLGVR